MGMQTSVPSIELNDGNSIPQVGFGVFQVPPGETRQAVERALEAGYRSIDTATAYGNEGEVGEAIAASGIPREDLYITTKLWNSEHGQDRARRAFETSLELLGLDRLDLYLIHWPVPQRDLYVESWRTMEELSNEGKVSSIGVSNFRVADLERLRSESETVPAINQIELHPLLNQGELRDYHQRHGIVTEAWSPLAKASVLEHPALVEIAAAHGRTAAQVVLRWHLQLGNVVIPKTVTPSRMAENLDLFGFELNEEQIAAINDLEDGTRTGPDPNTFSGD